MRTFIIGFLLFLCWLFVCRWHYVCKVRNLCGEQIEAPGEDKREKSLDFIVEGEKILEGYDQFRFKPKSPTPELNANNEQFIADLAEYLKQNPGRRILITGNYLPAEVDKDANGKEKSYGRLETLGLARADRIRQLLVAAGIDEKRMNLDHNLLSGTDLGEPVSFRGIKTKEQDNDNPPQTNGGEGGTPDEFETEGQQYSFTDMSFSDTNFDYNSAQFNPGSAFVKYAEDVVAYMEDHADKYIVLTGHTCDKGSGQYNMDLGKRRAESVKEYLRGKGVGADIRTASDGETNPAFPNTSEASRSKNRRVVLQIK